MCFAGSIDHYALGLQSYSHLVTPLSSLFRLQSAMRDLVDIFGPSSEPAPQPDDPWDAVKSPGDVTSDPWDSVGVCVTSRHRTGAVSLRFLFAFIV